MLAALAGFFGILMGIAPLFQVVRMVRQRSSADVSFLYVAVLVAGFGFFLAYGIALDNVVLIVSYAVSLVVGCLNLVVIGYFRTLGGNQVDVPTP